MVSVQPREGNARKIVFCEPPYVCWDRSMDRLRQGEETIPGMGVLTLAAVARQRGYQVGLVDAKGQGTSLEEVRDEIVSRRPDYLGLSATTISVTNAARIAEMVKGELPGLVTILGGPHVSAAPERTLERFSSIDFGVVGEGEVSLFEFLDAFEGDAAYDQVPGLVYRHEGLIVANARAPYIEDLDALPDPAWDLLPDFPHNFQPSLFGYPRTPVATLITSRGCPFSCTFCDRSTSGRKGRMHSVAEIVRLCRDLVRRGTRHIMFLDDLFTVRKDRVVDICNAFIEEGFDFSWSCNSHPNLLDFETMKLMKRAGCWQIAYGVESGSQRILNVVKHEVKLPRLRETLRMTRAAGIRTRGFLMLGHPTEGVDSLEETRQFLRVAELDLCQITKFTPYPGTPAYPTIQEFGSFDEDWEAMNAMNFIFLPNGLDEETLEYHFERCYRAFYTRPDILRGLVSSMIREPSFAKRLASSARTYVHNQIRNGRYRLFSAGASSALSG